MAAVSNPHVARLTEYLTFKPGHDQIYEERADPTHLRSIDTRAKQRLLELVKSPDVRLVVLTGDAGHGKTHLCRIVVEQCLGMEATAAQKLLNEHGDGQDALGTVGDRALHVVRDMSELRDKAIQRLVDAASSSGRVTVVCANEGKLRDVISQAGGSLDELARTLEQSQRTGRTSNVRGIHVLDLNHQSVTAGVNGGFLAELLKQWVMDGRRWRSCANCPAAEECPILRNRNLLSGEPDTDKGLRRREGLQLLLRVLEQTGVTITIRETLILVAFLVTAGLDCAAVQTARQPARRRVLDDDWDTTRLYFQLLFAPPLSRDQRATLPLLDTLSRFDPGRVSIRSVDESLIAVASAERANELEKPGSAAKPQTRQQAQSEAKRHREEMAFLRRRDFFDLDGDDEWQRMLENGAPTVARSERLGFRFLEEFERVLDGALDTKSTSAITDRIIRGLEAVQDVRRGSRQLTSLLVVDPAYGAVSGSASIVANQVSVKRISLMSRRAYWERQSPESADLPSSVDWLDRRIVILIQPKDEPVPLELNLLQFEFVMRSAHGLACRRFYQGDIRRILARLNELTELRPEDEDEILVVHRDRLLRILVQDSGEILCEGQP